MNEMAEMLRSQGLQPVFKDWDILSEPLGFEIGRLNLVEPDVTKPDVI